MSSLQLAIHRARTSSAFPKKWLPAKTAASCFGSRKNLSGHLPEHLSALSEYAALPWYKRAFKHSRAWVGNRQIALREWVLAQGRA